jgi:hypothetical protein
MGRRTKRQGGRGPTVKAHHKRRTSRETRGWYAAWRRGSKVTKFG